MFASRPLRRDAAPREWQPCADPLVVRWPTETSSEGGESPSVVCAAPTEDRGVLLLDIYQTRRVIYIEASAPGAQPEDVRITRDGRVLRIEIHGRSADQCGAVGGLPGAYVRRERYAGGWRRTVELPTTISGEGLTWTVEHGLLRLRIPTVPSYRRSHGDYALLRE